MTITASEYAKRIGYSTAAITKRLKSQPEDRKFLPGAISVKKFGNTWMIELQKNFDPVKIKRKFKGNVLVNSN